MGNTNTNPLKIIRDEMIRRFISFILFVWQLPQNLLGLAYKLILRGEKKILDQKGAYFYIAPTMRGGLSLGKYIFLSKSSGYEEPAYDHEFGHCLQSRMLGPLYLLVIGIPSGLHCILHDGTKNYYDFWTEKWANKLGGIDGYSGEFHYNQDGVIRTVFKDLVNFIKNM